MKVKGCPLRTLMNGYKMCPCGENAIIAEDETDCVICRSRKTTKKGKKL